MNQESIISKRVNFSCDIIDINGDLSFDHAKELEEFIEHSITGENPTVAINLSNVPMVNSSALSVIARIEDSLRKRKLKLVLLHTNEAIRDVFQQTGLKDFFIFVDSEATLRENSKEGELNDILDIS